MLIEDNTTILRVVQSFEGASPTTYRKKPGYRYDFFSTLTLGRSGTRLGSYFAPAET
ncbi:MAG: hypothetical protein JWO94_2602 [Verrucomicrobiaceae bacterium]|nr:hypothetical protein [Verrucomicrobiaceae bacterium]